MLPALVITNPEQVISVGDKVRVKVINVDVELKRIQLSKKALSPKPVAEKGRKPSKHSNKIQMKNSTDTLKNKWKPVSS